MTGRESSPGAGDDPRLIARTAAAIWAAVALFGWITTLESLRTGGEHIGAMQGISVFAAVMAVAMLVAVPRRIPLEAFSALTIALSLCVGALSYAAGPNRGDLTLLFTFVVVFAAYFLPWRTVLLQLAVIAPLLIGRLFAAGLDDVTSIEAIRLAMLIPALLVIARLVTILRTSVSEREARLQVQVAYDLDTGLLSEIGFVRALEAELSRGARHARPLTVVMIEVEGDEIEQAVGSETDPVTTIARAMVGRIRTEDHAAHLGGLRFGVIAPEASSQNAASVGTSIGEVVRRRLVTSGFAGAFEVRAGWASFPHSGQSGTALIRAATEVMAPLGDRIGRKIEGDAGEVINLAVVRAGGR